ncbi:MAG: hypothetical protein AAB739_05125 [Patescibacteria group bacterium]
MGIDEKESTPQEVADACREALNMDSEVCDEIAEQPTLEDALGLAFTALTEAGEDPESFLKEKGILE